MDLPFKIYEEPRGMQRRYFELREKAAAVLVVFGMPLEARLAAANQPIRLASRPNSWFL